MKVKKHFIILLSIFLFISCSDDSSSDNNIDEPQNISITQEIHNLVNQHRKTLNKNELIFNDDVANIALDHTEYMISKNKISHDGFDDRFTDLRSLVNAKSMAENVASKQRSAKEVVESWLNSSGHKKNIEGNYTHTGIGVKKNAEGFYFFTQLFYSK